MTQERVSTLELAVVMPAYNEEGCIESVCRRWSAAAQKISAGAKLIVVNDGSRDRTGEILEEIVATTPGLVVVQQSNGGHGKAVRTGYEKALELGAEWVFQVDSDDQFLPEEMGLLWEERSRSFFIAGRRLHRHDPLHRLVITRILRLLNLVLFGRYIADANIPFRLIRAPYLAALLQCIPASVFAPNIFLTILADLDGQNLLGIPVAHQERLTGKVSIVRWRLIKVCFRSAKELFLFRRSLRASLEHLRVARSAITGGATTPS